MIAYTVSIEWLTKKISLQGKRILDTLPRFALRPEALDEGRYVRFEQFLNDAGLLKDIRPVSQLAIDLGAK